MHFLHFLIKKVAGIKNDNITNYNNNIFATVFFVTNHRNNRCNQNSESKNTIINKYKTSKISC